MKKKITKHSLILLTLIIFFGLFQAWKESRNPFAFFKEKTQSKLTGSYKNTNYLEVSSIKTIKQ